MKQFVASVYGKGSCLQFMVCKEFAPFTHFFDGIA